MSVDSHMEIIRAIRREYHGKTITHKEFSMLVLAICTVLIELQQNIKP